jgi:hypothetical protein
MIFRDFFENRRLRKDLNTMFGLTDCFLSDIYRQADEHKNLLDMTEVNILAIYIVSDLYYAYSQNETRATKLLDYYTTRVAENLFNSNSASRIGCSIQECNELYDKFLEGFFDKTRERHLEYKNILWSDNKLTKNLWSACSELAKYFYTPSKNLDDATRRATTHLFGLTIAQHIGECVNSFKH